MLLHGMDDPSFIQRSNLLARPLRDYGPKDAVHCDGSLFGEGVKTRNYNLDIKNPNAEAAKHGDPDELLANYKKLLIEVAAARDALKNELAAALESTHA